MTTSFDTIGTLLDKLTLVYNEALCERDLSMPPPSPPSLDEWRQKALLSEEKLRNAERTIQNLEAESEKMNKQIIYERENAKKHQLTSYDYQMKLEKCKELLAKEESNTKYFEEELRKYKPQDEYTDDEDMDNEDNKLTEEEKVELPKLMEKFYNMMDTKGVFHPYNEIPDDYCLKVKHLFAITHRNPNMRKSYDVLEPQCYSKVTELNYNHDMLGREIGSEYDKEFEIGLFYTTDGLDRENIPGSGSGYDIWYLANRGLYNFFMDQLYPPPPLVEMPVEEKMQRT